MAYTSRHNVSSEETRDERWEMRVSNNSMRSKVYGDGLEPGARDEVTAYLYRLDFGVFCGFVRSSEAETESLILLRFSFTYI